MCKALLLFHFDFGDLVRWLGGDYTHDHIDHDSTKEALVALRSVQQGEFYPKQNFDRVFHSFIHGVPDNAAYFLQQPYRFTTLPNINAFKNRG